MKKLVYIFPLVCGLLSTIHLHSKEITLTTNQRVLSAVKGLGYGAISLGNAYGAKIFYKNMIPLTQRRISLLNGSEKYQKAATEAILLGSFFCGIGYAGLTAGKLSYASFKEAFKGTCEVNQEVDITLHQTKVRP